MIIKKTKRSPFEIEFDINYSKDGFEISIDCEGYEEDFENYKGISKEELQDIINELQKLHDSI